ncbi:MAG: DUF1405 domain-containing protein [Firmicutes bacterium]|nr:DUF1405 domain-containing protein [Bacillota bacterium]
MLDIIKKLWQNPWHPGFVLVLIIINFFGSLYGYYWYQQQLLSTPIYYWPVVPDSPLSTTLFALALLSVLLGWRFPILMAVALTTCIKYGLWAVALISHYWIMHGDIQWMIVMLWVSHLGMVAQAVWYWRSMFIPTGAALVAGGWMFFNDAMDYILGLHPYLYASDQLSFAAVSAVLFSVALSVIIINRRQTYRVESLL